MVKWFFCFITILGLAHAEFRLNEIGVGSGYGQGTLRVQKVDYEVVPVFIHMGWYLNDVFGFPNHKGKLSFVLEPFYNPILEPKCSQELGLEVMLQYAYPIIKKVSPYIEAGAGPMYLGLSTAAQGAAGFNFLDQLGAGLKIEFTPRNILTLGYRYRHISHAKLRGKPNKGIDTDAGIIIYSYLL
jgi:hypothetical protein